MQMDGPLGCCAFCGVRFLVMATVSSSPITSRANPRVKQLRAAFAGNARLAGGTVALEGETMLREALRSGLPLRAVFISEGTEVPAWLPAGVEVLAVAAEVFASAVDTQHPQGIAALIETPIWGVEAIDLTANPLLLVAVGVQDPGNLGTLIRSAEAFDATAVLTTPVTVSAWNQKSMRASAGSVFRVPVVEVTAVEIAAMKAKGVRLYAAVASPDSSAGGSAVSAIQADYTSPCALMIGNEGAGLGPEWLALADACVTIPMPGRVESLNAAVAGSLLLFEAYRQRAQLVPHNCESAL
jgi:TrmH family RNA methyltransferase